MMKPTTGAWQTLPGQGHEAPTRGTFRDDLGFNVVMVLISAAAGGAIVWVFLEPWLTNLAMLPCAALGAIGALYASARAYQKEYEKQQSKYVANACPEYQAIASRPHAKRFPGYNHCMFATRVIVPGDGSCERFQIVEYQKNFDNTGHDRMRISLDEEASADVFVAAERGTEIAAIALQLEKDAYAQWQQKQVIVQEVENKRMNNLLEEEMSKSTRLAILNSSVSTAENS